MSRVATDTLWASFRPQASSPRSADRRPAQVVDVTLKRRFVPFAMLKLGDGVRAFARVAIWTGINIDWIKRIGRLQLATIPPRDFRLARAYARVFLNGRNRTVEDELK